MHICIGKHNKANCYDNVAVLTTNAENNLHLIKAADYNQLFTPVTGLNLPHSGWDLTKTQNRLENGPD